MNFSCFHVRLCDKIPCSVKIQRHPRTPSANLTNHRSKCAMDSSSKWMIKFGKVSHSYPTTIPYIYIHIHSYIHIWYICKMYMYIYLSYISANIQSDPVKSPFLMLPSPILLAKFQVSTGLAAGRLCANQIVVEKSSDSVPLVVSLWWLVPG